MSEPGTAGAPVPDIPTRIRTGLSAGLRTAWKIIVISVPLYVAVTLLKGTPVLDFLGRIFAPWMGIFGLPGETAFAFVAAFLLNLYAGIAVIVPLNLDPFQVTQCGLMMGIAHNLVVEGRGALHHGDPGVGAHPLPRGPRRRRGAASPGAVPPLGAVLTWKRFRPR